MRHFGSWKGKLFGPSLCRSERRKGDSGSWCSRRRGEEDQSWPRASGGGPPAMAVPGMKRALHLTELSQWSQGLWFSVISSFWWWWKGRIFDPHVVNAQKGHGASSSWSSTSDGHEDLCSMQSVPWQRANTRVGGLGSWVSQAKSQTDIPSAFSGIQGQFYLCDKIKKAWQYLFSELVIKQLCVIPILVCLGTVYLKSIWLEQPSSL